ncbi:MAG TPA: patatin-like phospholipase family protein [Bacteriovoracaceae bacterium]|nr:patatin-like phospholipase family protein [Bacteriovoracaceae bacterium]
MSKKTGLVMTGGGARAAYQVGVVRALYEILKRDSKLFEVISGNSAGAINSTYLAANAENWDISTSNLSELWMRLKPQNIFDLSPRKISDLGVRWLSGTMLGGLTSTGSHINYLLDTAPLRSLVSREVDFSHISKNISDGHLHGVSLSTTNYNSGSSVIYYQGHPSISDWSRSDRFSHRVDLGIDHLMASAAIPFFFPPVKIEQSYFGDGCIRQTTPLSPAIHLGADKIIGIGVRYPHNENRMQDLAFSPFANPTLGQIAGVMLNSIFLDSLESDIERLTRLNELVKDGGRKGMKEIPILMIRPSRDLGKMTENVNKELPAMLRYLLKGIGVSQTEGLDLLSYLAFDESYTRPLTELGYNDAFKRKEDILRFNDV